MSDIYPIAVPKWGIEMVEGTITTWNKSEGDAIMAFMGGALPGQNTGIYKEASPLTHVGEHSPPMLFIDGELDRPGLRPPIPGRLRPTCRSKRGGVPASGGQL